MQPARDGPAGRNDPKGTRPGSSRGPTGEATSSRPLSALPSVQARVLAFAAIIVAGVCGALIGWSFVDLQCHGNCTVSDGTGSVVGAIIAASGVAVVAVLVLRAMGEWKTIKEERALAEATQAAIAATSPIDIPTEGSLRPDAGPGERPERSPDTDDGDERGPPSE